MSTYGAASYGGTAAAFLLLTLLLTTGWRRSPAAQWLVFASLATATWAGLIVLRLSFGVLPPSLEYLGEILRGMSWLVVLLVLGYPLIWRRLSIFVHGIWLAAAVLCAGILLDERIEALIHAWAGISLLPWSVCALVLWLQMYRRLDAEARQHLKFLAIGVGAVLAYDIALHSMSRLQLDQAQTAWLARGLFDALAVPFVAVAVRKSPPFGLDIFVSRQVSVWAAGLVGSSVLALLVWTIGSRIDGWSAGVGIAFYAVAGAAVLVALCSKAMRRQLRVFVSKHFYSNKFDYRSEWLRFIQTLSSSDGEDVGQTSLKAVAQIFSSPGALLFGLDASGRRFVPLATWPDVTVAPHDVGDVRRDSRLAQLMADREWIVDLAEYRRHPDRYPGVELPLWMSEDRRLRLISPLLQQDRLAGFIVLREPPPPFELTYEDRDLLKTVGRHVATHIARHEADRRLAESRQFEAYNRLTAFMMHDLKNSVGQLQLLVANAERHRRNPEFIDDAIDTIANTVSRMTELIEQLRRNASSSQLRTVYLGDLVHIAGRRCDGRVPRPILRADDDEVPVKGDPERLICVIEHLIRNAQDATMQKPDGKVSVSVYSEAGDACVDVVDTGCGMDPEFLRDRLFRPFDSTKGSKGMGIGAYQVREYVNALGGEIEVKSAVGLGTSFSIRLPASSEAAERMVAQASG